MADAPGSIPAFQDIVLRHSRDAALLLHPQDGVVYVSPACEHVTGLPSSQFLGMLAADWVHPDDVQSAIDQRRTADEEGHSGPVLIRGRHGDGSYHWYEAEWWHLATHHTVLHIRDVHGNDAAISSVVNDLAMLTAALEHSGQVVLAVDPSGPVRALGTGWATLGWHGERNAPTTWQALVHPEDHRAFSASVLGAPQTPVCHLAAADGTWVTWRIRAADLHGDRRVTGVLVYATRES